MKKAYALIIRNGLILLVRRPGVPVWDLPGGEVRSNETEREGIVRMISEDLGFESEIKELIGIYTREIREGKTYIYHGKEKYYQSKMTNRAFSAYEFFELHSLPINLLPERRRQINDYLSGRFPVRIQLKEDKYLVAAQRWLEKKWKQLKRE